MKRIISRGLVDGMVKQIQDKLPGFNLLQRVDTGIIVRMFETTISTNQMNLHETYYWLDGFMKSLEVAKNIKFEEYVDPFSKVKWEDRDRIGLEE